MIGRHLVLPIPVLLSATLCACAAPNAALTYNLNPSAAPTTPPASGGYNFVIPRTVVKVSVNQPAPDAKAAADAGKSQLSLAAAPVSKAPDGTPLKVFTVTDDSGSFGLTPTTLTSVSYLDRYIISSIGTQVTDNRGAAIDAVFSALGIAGKAIGFLESSQGTCAQQLTTSFVIDNIQDNDIAAIGVPNSGGCWTYSVKKSSDESGPDTYDVDKLPLNTAVTWFPYPVCRKVDITVENKQAGIKLTGSTGVSLGTKYQPITLPVKGKITMHTDYCGADATNDSSGLTSDWSLLQKVITDYQTLKSQGKSTSSK